MKQIKPCPFCGNDALFVSERNSKSYVRCGKCYAYGPDGKDKEEAIERWNAAPRKEDVEMEKNCANCKYLKLENKAKSKWYCTKALEDEYSSCKSWAPYNPFKPAQMTVCNECQYEYWDNGEHYCGKAIWNLDYSCPGWEAKESKSTPLNSSNSRGLYDGRNDCDYPNLSGGCHVFPAGKPFVDSAEEALDVIRTLEPMVNRYQMAAEEAAELAQALLKYCRACGHGSWTPINPKDATDAVIEEYADLLLAMEASFARCEGNKMFYNNLERVYKEKAKRWAERLKEHDN